MEMKRLFIVVVLSLGVFAQKMYSMEYGEPVIEFVKKPTLTVANKTHNKVYVAYNYKGDLLSFTLKHKQSMVLKNFSAIEAISVYPYGKVRGWLTTPNVPIKWFNKDLLVSNKKLQFAKINAQSATLSISSRWTPITWILGEKVAAEVSPYTYHVTTGIGKEIDEEYDTPFDLLSYFPQVEEAVNKDKRVLPRYFLNVGEYASKEAVLEAHERLRLQWQNRKDSSHLEEAHLAREILEILWEACMSICMPKEPNRFELLVAQYQPIENSNHETTRELTKEEQDVTHQVTEAFVFDESSE